MSEADSACPVKPGDVIAGKFQVERILGMGGMGVVVAAMHLELEQRVALKFLLPQAASHPDVAARFAREARAAAKIHCEHVARVIDVGTLPEGAPYMVMEFMDGEDLEHVLARCGPMPVDLATTYVLQASEAIAEAHAVGIVHRDLKPANLFLANRPNGDPIIKVLDFGISKSTLSTSQAQLTKTSSIMGSPLYMSPEQMTSAKTVDTRSDIWALGVVLYELLTRTTPFPAETMPELIAAILQAREAPVRSLRPDIPPQLEAIIQRCLEKMPANRFPNVAELAAALTPFARPGGALSLQRISHVLRVNPGMTAGGMPGGLGGGGVSPTFQNAPMGNVPPGGGATHAPWAQSYPGTAPAQGPRSRLGLYLAGASLLVTLAVGGVVLSRTGSHPAVVAAGSPTSAASAPPATPSAPTPPAVAAPPPSAAAEPAATAASAPPVPPTPVVAQPSPRSAAPAAAAPAAPAAHAKAAAAPAAQAPAKPAPAATGPECKLVSYIDSDGNKRFHQECR